MPKILIVDDNSEQLKPLCKALEGSAHQVEHVVDSKLAADMLRKEDFDVIVSDDHIEGSEDSNFLEFVIKTYPETRYIVCASNASVEKSVESLKKGAFDYVPCTSSPEKFVEIIEKAAVGSDEVSDSGDDALFRKFAKNGFIGKSPEITGVFNTILKVASTDSTVLITGESGTGKELIARAIHNSSQRRSAPMVVINCGAIPGELLESELFGHEKGSFTGAHRTRIGRFEMADGGTIFLDEIGDMSPDLQVKLLRAIQEQRFERVGSTKSVDVNIRIISATNKDLSKAIDNGTFREDLYYRLNVIPIKVPPLRLRKTDIPLLIEYFLGRNAERMSQNPKTLSESALRILTGYQWPGNIRELENLMERLSVLVDSGTIEKGDLPDRITGNSGSEVIIGTESIIESGMGFNEAVEQHQKALILSALKQTNWVKAKAAELLKINRTTLVEKIKKMNLEAERKTDEDMDQPGRFFN